MSPRKRILRHREVKQKAQGHGASELANILSKTIYFRDIIFNQSDKLSFISPKTTRSTNVSTAKKARSYKYLG